MTTGWRAGALSDRVDVPDCSAWVRIVKAITELERKRLTKVSRCTGANPSPHSPDQGLKRKYRPYGPGASSRLAMRSKASAALIR